MSLGSAVVEDQQSASLPIVSGWDWEDEPPAFSPEALQTATTRFREPVAIIRESENGRVGVGMGGQLSPAVDIDDRTRFHCLGLLPALYPEWLGDRAFTEVHNLRFPYVAGAMARGIGSASLVIAMGQAGMLGFFGSAGLAPDQVEAGLIEISSALGPDKSWGSNLIHSPNQAGLEEAVVDRLLRHDVRRVSASAYIALTPAIVRCAYSGARVGPDNHIIRRHIFAKISRPEVARRFMSPPPTEMLHDLVNREWLTVEEARLAAHLPVAEDITVEADSGGHTDNQPLPALFPTILRLRDDLSRDFSYSRPIRVGASGGLGTPVAVAAAFSLGAAYVLTGSVNQACIESGVSSEAKLMLANTLLGDVAMSPSADMFELGVKVQVLKRGTMFAARASQLYDLYTQYPSLESLPADVVARLEKQIFRQPLTQVWAETERFFAERDPQENERAAHDPKHQMALVFRWYLGNSSRWPLHGESSRQVDYQVWCGPAMGAFNDWVRGSFLELPANRRVVQVALNLLEGAAQITRAQQLRTYGVPVPTEAFQYRARPLA